MGFFKKIFKGVKKVFKKIGKGIKKAVGKIGKFMGKLGIVGQIGLGLLLPGIGSAMGTMFGKLATSLMSSTYGVVRGAGQVINAAINIGTGAGKLFSSITEGVTSTIGEITGTVLNKMGIQKVGTVNLADKDFSNLWGRTQEAFSGAAEAGRDLFSMDTLTADNVFMKKTQEVVAGTAVDTSLETSVEDPFGYSEQPIVETAVDTSLETSVEDPFGYEVSSARPTVAATPVEPQPSLLSRAKTGAIERTRAAIAGAPEQFVKTGVANIAAIPRDIVRSAFAPTPEVTYNVRQPAIPDIGFAGIGQEFAQPAFDSISYFDQNQALFNQNPFGFGAALYGDATYFKNMQGYGFQTPMYGMS